ncbi:unnamed protein product, partial [Laminaria digitata]
MSETAQDEEASGGRVEEAQGNPRPSQRRHSAYASSQLVQSAMAAANATEHPLSNISRSRSRSSPQYRLGQRLGLSDHSSDVSALSVEVAVAEASRYSPSVSRHGSQDPRHGRGRSKSVSALMGTSRSSSVRGSLAMPRERSRRSVTQARPSGANWSDSAG